MTPIDIVVPNIESSITHLNELSSPNVTRWKTAPFITNRFFEAKRSSWRTGSFYRSDFKIRPYAQVLGTKARVPTPKAQELGLPARLPMTQAQVLLPPARVLEASARVLAVQADRREEQKRTEIGGKPSGVRRQSEAATALFGWK